MEPGIYDGLDNDVYHASPGISKSGLSIFADSPARYRWGERPKTRPLFLGSLIHCAVLEPEQLEHRYFVTDLKTLNPDHKAYREEEQRAAGAELVKRTDFDQACYIRDSVMGHNVARSLIDESLIVERSGAWIDPETGVLCRLRADGINKAAGVIIDAKSCEDASWSAFSNAMLNYRYHWQDVIYRDGLEHAEGWRAEAMVFIAIEKTKPYLVGAYKLDAESRALGHDQVRAAMSYYAKCKAEDHWPGHSDFIEEIRLPNRAFRG